MSAPDPHRWRAIPAAKAKRNLGALVFQMFVFGGLIVVLALLVATLTVGAQS